MKAQVQINTVIIVIIVVVTIALFLLFYSGLNNQGSSILDALNSSLGAP